MAHDARRLLIPQVESCCSGDEINVKVVYLRHRYVDNKIGASSIQDQKIKLSLFSKESKSLSQ